MEIKVQTGDIVQVSADTIITNLFANVKKPSGATGALDQALDGAISELIEMGDLTGKMGEVRVIYPRTAMSAKRIIIVGLGIRRKFNALTARNAAAQAIRIANAHKAEHVATIIHGAGSGGLNLAKAAQATTEGSILALNKYPAPKQRKEPPHTISTLTIIENDAEKATTIEDNVRIAEAICTGVVTARDLTFLPANVATPSYIADLAQQIADNNNLTTIIGDRAWAAEHNMGAYLGVAQGAGYDPKFIILEHNAYRTDLPTIVLVGKGITFDTGGISLKPSAEMWRMKNDMGGCAAVIGTMQAISELNLPLRIIGITPCTENMPDANAIRPGDVLTASNGKTIEIISTDAEGRLVLADALVYASSYKPNLVIDLATLTGTAGLAMGSGVAAAMFSTDDSVTGQLMRAGNATHERVWPFPLWDDYNKAIKSASADIKNSGGRKGGLATSAMFLKNFTDYPWVHLDIAAMVLRVARHAQAYEQHDATGFGVRLLVEFLRSYQSDS